MLLFLFLFCIWLAPCVGVKAFLGDMCFSLYADLMESDS
jgi:hypothetical protein